MGGGGTFPRKYNNLPPPPPPHEYILGKCHNVSGGGGGYIPKISPLPQDSSKEIFPPSLNEMISTPYDYRLLIMHMTLLSCSDF